MVLLQIAIGVFDLGAGALAMYVLIPAEPISDFSTTAVFIAATLLGFASHTPAGIGIRRHHPDRAWRTRQGTVIAALLMFRLLYHFLPFVLALGLFAAWKMAALARQAVV